MENHLYEFFQPGINSQILKLPPGFLKEGVDQVSVRGSRSTREECVEIYRYSEDHVYFNEGWENFVEKHNLEENDFMLLKYDGGTCFTITIFHQNGLEKVFHPNPQTFITPPTNIINLEDDEEEVGETSSNSKKRSKNQTRNESSSHHYTPGQDRKKREYNIMMEKSKSFSSDNAFFWRLLKDYHVYHPCTMIVPKPIAKPKAKNMFKFNEASKVEVSLKNREGRTWELVLRKSNGQYFMNTSGWKRFVVDNSLKVGDVCIFERVSGGRDSVTVWQVHVF